MEKEKIQRINVLAKKAKETGLTEDERLEQEELRAQYLLDMRKNIRAQLEQTYVLDENGNEVKLQRKIPEQ